MSEIALVSVRKVRLENMAEKGDENAKTALELSQNPEVFLSTAQIGITLIAILTGVYSGERFGVKLQPVFEKISFLKPYAATISITVVVIIVTFLSIIFGELIPKYVGLVNNVTLSYSVAPTINFLQNFLAPVRKAVIAVTAPISRIMFFFLKKEKEISIDELRHALRTSQQFGVLGEDEVQLMRGYLHLQESTVKECMRPREEVLYFDMDESLSKIMTEARLIPSGNAIATIIACILYKHFSKRCKPSTPMLMELAEQFPGRLGNSGRSV